MKLLYTCADNANDPHLWSGTVWNCQRALAAAGCEIETFDRIPFECPPHLRLLHQFHKRLGKKIHLLQLEPAILRRAARRIEAHFARTNCDAIFSPGTGVPVYAYVDPKIPVFSYLDATKLTWIRTYFGLDTLCARSRRHVDATDRVSLANNTLTFVSSDWAAQEAIRDYAIAPDRFVTVPFGANLTHEPTRDDVNQWITSRSRDKLHLFFLGKEWDRKGGPEAIALVRALRAQNIPVHLDIVGCTPPPLDPDVAAHCTLHGFIDHSRPEGREKFQQLLTRSHALLFLSRAEAFGIALCEAAAHGVPAYATAVGGIPTIVRHNENGWLSPTPFSAEAAAHTLAAAFRSPETYQRLALGARHAYDTRLNWRAAATTMRDAIAAHLDGTARLQPGPSPARTHGNRA